MTNLLQFFIFFDKQKKIYYPYIFPLSLSVFFLVAVTVGCCFLFPVVFTSWQYTMAKTSVQLALKAVSRALWGFFCLLC